jgi:hypothetical protein
MNDVYDRKTDTSRSSYDRMLEMFLQLPDTKTTRPATHMTVMPIVGDVRTFVVRSSRSAEYGFALFLEIAGPDGLTRIALPNKVVEAIYRQHDALVDRSTPASRARKAASTKRRKEREAKAARKAGRTRQ